MSSAKSNGTDGRDVRTVMAKPFPSSMGEDAIKRIFEGYGKVKNVKLRRDKHSNVFSGSAWVEFELETAAKAAMTAPPLQPGSPAPLSIVTRAEVARQKNGGTSAGTPGAGHSGGPSSSAPISASNGDGGGAHQQHASGGGGGQSHHGGGGRSGGGGSSEGGGGRLSGHKRPPPPPPGEPAAAVSGVGSGGADYWQSVAEDRDTRIRTLESQVAAQKEAASGTIVKLTLVQQQLDVATLAEEGGRNKLRQKDSEIGALKGEVSATRSQMRSQVDQLHQQYKSRLHDNEVLINKLKEDVATLRQRHEGRAAKSVTPPPPAGNNVKDEFDDL